MKKTPLYEIHKNLGAKIVEFGGWMMPVSYSGVLDEHHAVRKKMGMFDVSHMGEVLVTGPQALDFLQYLTSNDVASQKIGQCQYNLLMNEKGGLVDDIIVNRVAENEFFICVNASNTDKDFEWMKSHAAKFNVTVENQSAAFGQIAIQGPLAKNLINRKNCSLEEADVGHFIFQKQFYMVCL